MLLVQEPELPEQGQLRMVVTLNENCRFLEDYPAEVIAFEEPYFLHAIPFGCVAPIRITPGHVVEEDEAAKAVEQAFVEK